MVLSYILGRETRRISHRYYRRSLVTIRYNRLSLPHEFSSSVDHTLPQFSGLVFLIIDDHAEGRFLISKTLLRKFPKSTIVECQSTEAAFRELETRNVSLIITHRTFEFEGIALLRELRERAPEVPMLMTSGIDRREAALAAGANAFLTYDEWLMVGNRVATLLTERHRLKGAGC